MHSTMRIVCVLLLSWFRLFKAEELTCSWTKDELDPALKEMTYNVGDGEQKFMAYVEPDMTSMYQGNPPASTKVVPKFNGLAAKFINMSKERLNLYWEPRKGGHATVMRHYTPFSSGGTATFPGHRFFLTPEDDPDHRLIEFLSGEYPENIHVYDPYLVEGDEKQTEANLQSLTSKEREFYEKWRKTLAFNEQYRNFTGRSYLSNYLRKPPQYFMWRADYFGQEHWVTTRETHFETVPKIDDVEIVTTRPEKRILKDSAPRLLEEHRVKDQTVMNMTLKVLSCAPRVLEISNFLSKAEVAHIIELAGGIELKDSMTGDVGSTANGAKQNSPDESNRLKTRTSRNSWVPRETSEVVDSIYRRAADLLRMDEALLRHRGKREHPKMPTKDTVSESLQLVHYGVTQEVRHNTNDFLAKLFLRCSFAVF
jgi:hypothetical protein